MRNYEGSRSLEMKGLERKGGEVGGGKGRFWGYLDIEDEGMYLG